MIRRMFARNLVIGAVGSMIALAGFAGANGSLGGGFQAAYDLVAGFEVDATGAQDLLIQKKAQLRQEAHGVVDQAFAHDPCQAYATTDVPQIPVDQLESRLDTTHAFQKGADLTHEFDAGLVRAKAWGVGDVTGQGWLEGSDALPQAPVERPDLSAVCDLHGQARAEVYEALQQDVQVDVPTSISHEEGLDGATSLTGSAQGLIEAGLP